jgi:hypothetical protein
VNICLQLSGSSLLEDEARSELNNLVTARVTKWKFVNFVEVGIFVRIRRVVASSQFDCIN